MFNLAPKLGGHNPRCKKTLCRCPPNCILTCSIIAQSIVIQWPVVLPVTRKMRAQFLAAEVLLQLSAAQCRASTHGRRPQPATLPCEGIHILSCTSMFTICFHFVKHGQHKSQPWLVSQRSLHNAPIFRLLLKVAVNGTHQCDFINFGGQQCPTYSCWQGNCSRAYALLHVPVLLFSTDTRCAKWLGVQNGHLECYAVLEPTSIVLPNSQSITL